MTRVCGQSSSFIVIYLLDLAPGTSTCAASTMTCIIPSSCFLPRTRGGLLNIEEFNSFPIVLSGSRLGLSQMAHCEGNIRSRFYRIFTLTSLGLSLSGEPSERKNFCQFIHRHIRGRNPFSIRFTQASCLGQNGGFNLGLNSGSCLISKLTDCALSHNKEAVDDSGV